MPCGSAVTSEAAQPSPHRQNEISFSSSVVSLRCSVHSSMLTISTRALRVGPHDVARQLQGVDRGIASHEADDGALDRRRQAASLHQFEVDAGRGKAGAAS